ncbi:hypothetical protein Tco_1308743 [Tanacetum coccineum]
MLRCLNLKRHDASIDLSPPQALEDLGELFDTLMDLRDDREASRTKLQGLNELITQSEFEVDPMTVGRNELLEKIIGYVVDSGGVSELDLKDENNHSNGNVVKRGITRLSKFRREYGKPDGIKLSVKSAAAKMACSKSVYQHTIGRGGYTHVKQKMKETEDKIKEGTLKVDHGADAMTVVLGKEKGGYARGVGSGVTYKRYFDLHRSRQASDERIALLESQLNNERREREEKELEIQNLSNKMSKTEGIVTKLMNQLAAQGEQLQSMSTKLTPSDVPPVDINPIDNNVDEEGGTPLSVAGCENDASIQKSNGLATLEKEMETKLSNEHPPCDF